MGSLDYFNKYAPHSHFNSVLVPRLSVLRQDEHYYGTSIVVNVKDERSYKTGAVHFSVIRHCYETIFSMNSA